MTKGTRCRGLARLGGAAALLALGTSATAAAPPSPAQMLAFTPRQAAVECTTPAPDKVDSCKVDLVKGGRGSGWIMADANGAPLRRFYDSNEDNKIDVWSFFRDGAEIYRELDSNHNGKPDQFRWLNAGGTRWGVDVNEDGRIDAWKSISPEEVSQELLQAVATGDYARVQALLLSEAEITALKLSPAEAQRLREVLKKVQPKFTEMAAKLKDAGPVAWLHLETSTPACRPADAVGSPYDFVRQPRGTVIYDAGGKSDWIHIGELVKVGEAWRLVDGPTHGTATIDHSPAAPHGGTPIANNPKLQKLIEELTEIDRNPPTAAGPGPHPEVVKYNLNRADVLEKILAEVPAKDRDPWVRQVADSLATALQNTAPDDAVPSERLNRMEKQLVESAPGTPTTAYVVYRHMQADYAHRLLRPDVDYAKLQQEWMEKLTKFVADYPKADDADDALLQLGMTCEFLGKEADGKKWYGQLVKDFADKPLAAKARGALKRLELEGKPMELAGTTLQGGRFDISALKGKVVAVYYWASWNQMSADDFSRLKKLVEEYGAKGFEVVGVNLDSTAEEAKSFVGRVSPPGIHLHEEGGLESGLASDYGIMVLPNVFLVGADGKVVSRTVQVSNLEDEVKKLLK